MSGLLVWAANNKIASVFIFLCLLLAGFSVFTEFLRLPGAYKDGYKAAATEISSKVGKATYDATKAAIEKERKQNQALAAEQARLEKEKNDAKIIINSMRDELGRLRNFAKNRSSAANVCKGSATASKHNGDEAAKGWVLFGESAETNANLAEVADSYRDTIAQCQVYMRAVAEHNKN